MRSLWVVSVGGPVRVAVCSYQYWGASARLWELWVLACLHVLCSSVLCVRACERGRARDWRPWVCLGWQG